MLTFRNIWSSQRQRASKEIFDVLWDSWLFFCTLTGLIVVTSISADLKTNRTEAKIILEQTLEKNPSRYLLILYIGWSRSTTSHHYCVGFIVISAGNVCFFCHWFLWYIEPSVNLQTFWASNFTLLIEFQKHTHRDHDPKKLKVISSGLFWMTQARIMKGKLNAR